MGRWPYGPLVAVADTYLLWTGVRFWCGTSFGLAVGASLEGFTRGSIESYAEWHESQPGGSSDLPI